MTDDITVRFSGNHPTRAYPTDAGWDLAATDDRVVPVRAIVKVPTGTFVDLPAGSYGMICSRSGLVAKHGLAVANAPGIIDAGYTGEIFVTLVNLGPRPYRIEEGERIAQIVLGRTDGIIVPDAPASLSNLARGENGHGSSATLNRQTDREDRHE